MLNRYRRPQSTITPVKERKHPPFSVVFFVGMTIIFVGLKLYGVIDWPWVWVMSPLIFGAALYVTILAFFWVALIAIAVVMGIGLLAALIVALLDRK